MEVNPDTDHFHAQAAGPIRERAASGAVVDLADVDLDDDDKITNPVSSAIPIVTSRGFQISPGALERVDERNTPHLLRLDIPSKHIDTKDTFEGPTLISFPYDDPVEVLRMHGKLMENGSSLAAAAIVTYQELSR